MSRVNLHTKGIPMIADQAYYVGDDEFVKGFIDIADTLKRIPISSIFFSTMKGSILPGLLASSETGDIRFKTQSKNNRIAADDWPTFTVSLDTYNSMLTNSPDLADKMGEVVTEIQTGKRWVKKGGHVDITLEDISFSSRREILADFYRSLGSKLNPRASVIPAYFHAEICYQAFNALIKREAIEPHQEDYRILDPTAGWGDRMIGFALTAYITKKRILYHANDMNEELSEPYARLIDKLNMIDGLSNYFTATYSIADALDLNFEMIGDGKWNEIDLVFTSPPYYDMEDTIRGNITYPSYKEWEVAWFTPFIEHMINIDPYAVVMLHLANTSRAPLIDSIKQISPAFNNYYYPRRLDWNWEYGKQPVLIFRVEDD